MPIDLAAASSIFDHVPGIIFYVKDAECRWLTCNEAALALLRLRSAARAKGRLESEVFPRAIAEAIHLDDRKVIDDGATIVDRLETIIDQSGRPAWASTSKIPLRTTAGEICGLVGITRIVGDTGRLGLECDGLAAVLDYIDAHHAAPLSLDVLTGVAKLSATQLRARFKRRFHLTPMQFVGRVRLQAASHLLARTAMPIVDVALQAGFCDQNYMTRQFGRYLGTSPRRYRERRGRP